MIVKKKIKMRKLEKLDRRKKNNLNIVKKMGNTKNQI